MFILLLAEEPSTITYAATGLLTIGAYLLITGKWRNLRRTPPAAALPAEETDVQEPEQRAA